MMSGKNEFEILAHVPKYFQINLKDKKAPGKIIFTHLDSGTSFKAYLSYNDSRPGPDCKNNDNEIFVGAILKNPPSLEIKCKALGPNFVYEHSIVYLAFFADIDTNIKINLKIKKERNDVMKGLGNDMNDHLTNQTNNKHNEKNV